MRKQLKATDVQIKLALIFVFGFFYLYAMPYAEKSRQFPQLIALVSLILVIISLILDFTKKEFVAGEIGDIDDTEVKVLADERKTAKKQRFYKAWGIIIFSTAVGFLGGFLFSSILLFLGFSIFFGKRENLVRNIITGMGITAVVYFIFGKVMMVPLLAGILW